MSGEVEAALITGAATIVAALIGLAVYFRGKRDDKDGGSYSTSAEARRRKHKYDLFVSSPLAAFASDAELAKSKEQIAQLVAAAEQLGFSVYWAGRNIATKNDFDAADISATQDVAAILDSKYFLMVYPARIVSSVIFEAGIALNNCLTSIYFVQSEKDLPFLMTQASQAFKNVRTYVCATPAEHLGLLKKHGVAFFEPNRSQ
ncbi:MAG TPA: hypothetical protein VFL30_00715 [Rhodanobacteraceae bacterium]|nr:hypothetical protein [Rhodanobacteraceae bacterium]